MSFRIKKIEHVAICVEDIDAALAPYRDLLGLKEEVREASEELGTAAVLFPIGESHIELITPYISNPGLEKFLEKRGPGLHHIAIEVEGLDAGLLFLKALGVALIDETPRIGARGHRVAFLHPKAFGGVLVELVEAVEAAESVETPDAEAPEA